jgi:hypothetical protein
MSLDTLKYELKEKFEYHYSAEYLDYPASLNVYG